jgi:hypothetical protein
MVVVAGYAFELEGRTTVTLPKASRTVRLEPPGTSERNKRNGKSKFEMCRRVTEAQRKLIFSVSWWPCGVVAFTSF